MRFANTVAITVYVMLLFFLAWNFVRVCCDSAAFRFERCGALLALVGSGI
jgi:hypothetical protein